MSSASIFNGSRRSRVVVIGVANFGIEGSRGSRFVETVVAAGISSRWTAIVVVDAAVAVMKAATAAVVVFTETLSHLFEGSRGSRFVKAGRVAGT